MGRYRGGHRKNKQWWKKKKNDNSSSHHGMPEADSMLVEKYLSMYRTKAFALLNTPESKQHEKSHLGVEKPYTVGSHIFPALTNEICRQPYIDLPDSLTGKERKHIHALCCMLDLHHCGAGSNAESDDPNAKKRRIVVSIFANGLANVPDIESPHNDNDSFPSRKCRPWYNCASSALKSDLCRLSSKDINQLQSTNGTVNNSYVQRIVAIEEEKELVSRFAKYPEQSLRTSARRDVSSNDSDAPQIQIDSLDLSGSASADLSRVPTPNKCPWMLVDTVQKFEECVNELMFGLDYKITNPSRVPLLHELAFDLEMYNHSGGEKKTALRTCLIQLTSNVAEKDYVIDPLAPGIWDTVCTHLGPLFSDASVVKIGHGIGGMDTTSLHRDFGIIVVNAFDTHEASAVLANRKKGGLGLASLCRHYGLPSWKEYSELKHMYQASNWSKRPLDAQALEYGRFDVRCLIMLRKLLMRDLVQRDMIGGKNPFNYLMKKGPKEGKRGALSTQSSNAETSTNESVTESSFSREGSMSIESYSQPSSFDEFKDVMHIFDDGNADEDDESADDFVDAKEMPSPTKEQTRILHAMDLPSFHHLMQAMKISNKRCLSLWAGDDEEHALRHPKLLSMIEQSRTGKGLGRFWSDANHKLFIALTKWRFEVAEREGIDAYEVCSLDFLLHAAYKTPLDRHEMRRFTYFLPELLEDDRLPYCQELQELIASSDAFKLRKQLPLAEMERFDVVFYRDPKRERRLAVLKILLGTATIVGIASILMMRKIRRR
jgi:hypothetical protein